MTGKQRQSKKRRGRVVPRLIFSAVMVMMLFLVVEATLRLTAGEPWYERIVEEQAAARITMQRIGNSVLPLRAPLDDRPKTANAYRILFLGDSFTYGEGLSDETETFVRRTVARLNDLPPVSKPVFYEAFNGGMPASLTPHWVRLCDEILDSYAPDLVVAVFFLRDGLEGVTSIGQIDQIREGMRQLAEDSFLFRSSAVYRYFKERRAQADLSQRYLSKMRTGYLGDETQTRQWRRAQADLLAIKQRARAVGSRFALVVFPVLFDLGPNYPLRDVCDEIMRFCRANEIPVMSLLPVFEGQDAESLWISPLDQHPNALGHTLASDGMFPFIRTLVEGDASNHGDENG